jgi:hypothetical protein
VVRVWSVGWVISSGGVKRKRKRKGWREREEAVSYSSSSSSSEILWDGDVDGWATTTTGSYGVWCKSGPVGWQKLGVCV